MYLITYGTLDIASTISRKYAIASGVISQQKNTADSFVFVLPATHPYRDVPQIRQDIVKVTRDGKTVFMGDVISTRLKFDGSREITCQGCLAWLNDVCSTKIDTAASVAYSFSARMTRYNSLCKQTRRIEQGVCTNKPTSTAKIFDGTFISIFEYFKRLIDAKGGMMLPRYEGDIVYLDYLDTKNKVSDQEIYFGKNLLDLENYISAENTITALYPTGKDGITIESVNPTGYVFIRNDALYSRYGMIAQNATYDSETPAELFADATATLNALAVLNQTIKLTASEYPLVDSIAIGDNVHSVSAPHGLDTMLECGGRRIDLVNRENSTITLGKTLKSLSKIVAMGGIK